SPTGSGCFASTSNGLASGNHLLEAILHGICEVIERDSTTLWEASGSATQQQTRIDINTIDDLNCRQVIEKCHQAGVEVAVWETTSDIGVPSFISQICDRTDATFNPLPAFTGMGCHSTREIALLRSLTEAVQCRLTLIAGSRDDMFRNQYKNDLHRERITAYQFKTSNINKTPQRYFQQVPTYHGETFDDDIIWVLERLKAVGIERVITVNLTKSEFNLSVVRVVIPGLEGPDEDPEYVPGVRVRSLERVHT
ncbi:MAG: YcaO-like family protein, partial [Cyanobacteriota bacterium]